MNFLERLKTSLNAPAAQAMETDHHDLQIAAAVLLLEMERADQQRQPRERAEMQRQLQQLFELSDAEAGELLESAQPRAEDAISLHRFVEAINASFDISQKRQVLSMLWHVAFADDQLDAHEEHLLRNVADWLHLAHRDFIQTKLEAEAARSR